MKKGIYFLCLIILAFFLVGEVLAQETPRTGGKVIVVATTGIEEAAVVSQEQNKIKLKFKINNQENNQPDIRYAVELFKDSDTIATDRKVFAESLSLGPQETIEREIEYNAPDFLKGTFTLWIKAFNEKGLPLGIGMAGKIDLAGSEEYVEINEKDCYLSVRNDSENKKYTLAVGVDVDAQEELILNCKISNKFKTEKQIVPLIQTYFRSSLGKLIKTDRQDAVSLKSGESRAFSLITSKASEPQAYDAVLTFLDEKNSLVSPPITFRYVLRGQSATIQNLRLDKNYYQKGENAQVSFNWLPAADNFYGSRKTGTSIGEISLNMEIGNEKGALCAPAEKKKIKESEIESGFTVLITNDCVNPQVALTIMNEAGETLDSAKLAFQSKDIKMAKEKANKELNLKNILKWIFIITMALIVVIIISMIIINKRKNNPPSVLFLAFFALVFGAILLVGSEKAQAAGATFTVVETYADCMYSCQNVGGWTWSACDQDCINNFSSPRNSSGTFNVNLNKSTYSLGEAILTSGWAMGGNCANSDSFISISATVYGYNVSYNQSYGALLAVTGGGTSTSYYSTGFWNPGVVGNYRADFMGAVYAWHNAGGTQGHVNLDFSVVAPVINGVCGSSNGGTFATAPMTNLCSTGTPSVVSGSGPWTWTCAGSGGGTTANCSANIAGPPPATVTLNITPSYPATVPLGSSSSLTWTANNATSCTATGAWSGSKNNTSGTESVTPPNLGSNVYSIQCVNSAGTPGNTASSTITTTCVPNCNQNDQYCNETTYTGNCGQTCTGTAPSDVWTAWSDCSASCGGGTETHSRTCIGVNPTTETRSCNSQPCPPNYREVAPW